MKERLPWKRTLAWGLVLIMLLSAGCGTATPAASTSPSPAAESTTTERATPQPVEEVVAEQGGPFAPYPETVVLTYGKALDPSEQYGEGESPEVNQYTRNVRDVLNIDAQTYWQAASGPDYEQKVNLSIASNDLPDAMVVNATQLRQMVKADQLADLTEAYEQYGSSAMKYMMGTSQGLAERSITFDGKMLALPTLNVPADSYHLMWIRKDWLEKLGLEVPKTVDDLERVAKAFIEQDPNGTGQNDTIGIAGPQNGGSLTNSFLLPNNTNFGLVPLFAAHRSYPGFWLTAPNGEVSYGSIQPETRTALERMADLYEKGILDKQISVRKDTAELIASGTTGIYFGMWWNGYWPLPDAWKNDPTANWQAYPLFDDQGTSNFTMGTPCNAFMVVRKGYAHPEAAVKIVGLNNRDENSMDLTLSSLGNQVLRLPMGAYDEMEFELNAIADYLAGTKNLDSFTEQEYAIYKLMRNDLETVRKVKKEPFDMQDIEYWNMDGDPNFPRLYSMMVGTWPIYDPATNKHEVFSALYSQTKTMETRWANLKKLEDETFLRIIMGAAPIEDFDKFVDDWNTQGGAQITAEVKEEASAN